MGKRLRAVRVAAAAVRYAITGSAPASVAPQVVAYHQGSAYGGGHGGDGAKYAHGLAGTRGVFLNADLTRQGVRRAMQDSPEGRAIVERKAEAVAHTGLRLEAAPDKDVLGISGEEAAEWGAHVSALFALWASDRRAHRSESMTFDQAQSSYAFWKERDNDIFVRFYYSPDASLQNPLQFGFIDPDQIRGTSFMSSYGGMQQKDGITRDARGRETAYDIWLIDPATMRYRLETIQARGPKSGRIFMLHGFQPGYAGQGRGITKLAPVLQELELLQNFSLAHIQLAMSQLNFVAWLENEKEDNIPAFPSITNAGPGGMVVGEEGAAVASGLPMTGPECYSIPEATAGVPSMLIQNLTAGQKVVLANPNAPVTTYGDFKTAYLSDIAAAAGIPLEIVRMKFSNNFSASRATLLLFYRIVEIVRADMANDFLNPTYSMWLAGEIAAGRIVAPGWTDPRLRAAWMRAAWQGPTAPDIDPVKTAKGRELSLRLGLTSAERESQMHSGTGAAANIAANERIYGQEIQPFGAPAPAPAEAPEPDDDEPNEDKS